MLSNLIPSSISVYLSVHLIDIVSRYKIKFFYRYNSFLLKKNLLSDSIQNYCTFNQEYFGGSVSCKSKNIILMDVFTPPEWVIVNSFLCNNLATKYNAYISSYDVAHRGNESNCLYNSFGCNNHLIIKLDRPMSLERKRLFLSIINSVKTKHDLQNLIINKVWIGLDIYESILRTGVPTVNVSSLVTHRQIYRALTYYLFFNKLFSKGRVKAVVLSHDNYISMGLVARVAYRYNISCYFVNPFEMVKSTRTFQIFESYKKFPNYFDTLSDQDKKSAILWSKAQLRERLSGTVGVNMSYQIKSAFVNDKIKRQTSNSDKIKIVIAMHCFFDNPNGIGWMLFPDFYDWLCFLGEVSNSTDYEWYIKTHADYLDGNLEILDEIILQFPKLKMIDSKVSWHQLKDEGVEHVLTCYGTLGGELPLLGYKVINAAYNPHIAYKFNYHPRTIDEYREILTNLSQLPDVKDINKIYEFYYVKHNIFHQEDLFFDSYNDYLENSNGDPMSHLGYDYFVSNSDSFARNADIKTKDFINSNQVYSYET